MQETVTFRYVRKKPKLDILKIFLCVIFSIFLLIFFVLMFKINTVSYFKSREYYLVSVASSTRQKDLELLSSELELGGGGAVIFSYNNMYYLIASVYLDESDANEIAENLSSKYANASVLKIITKKVSGSVKKLIKINEKFNKFFEFKYSAITEFCEMQMKFLLGEVTDSELEYFIVKNRFELENLLETEKQESESLQTIATYQALALYYFDDIELNFFQSTLKASVLARFVINFVILDYNLCNNL